MLPSLRHGASICTHLVTDVRAFDALQPEWDALYASCARGPHLFQSFNWNWHWTRHYLGETSCAPRLAIACVRQADRLVALLPLMQVRRFGLRLLMGLGDPVSQYTDVLLAKDVDSDAVLDAGFAHAVRVLGADALYLRKVRADADVRAWLVRQGARITLHEEAPYLDLASAPTFEAYSERYSSKARKNRRRLARRLADKGTVRVARHTSAQAGRNAVLAAIELKQRRLKDAGQPALAVQDTRFAQFFADAVEGGSHPCDVAATCLTVDDKIAACLIDIGGKHERAAHILVHEAEFACCGPGMLIVEEWARAAHADGVARLDFLAPAHPYKMEFADGVVAVEDFALPLTVKGRAFTAYAHHMRPNLKRLYERYAQWRACGSGAAKRSCGRETEAVS